MADSHYGSRVISNRVKPGKWTTTDGKSSGTLSSQYFYKTNKESGEITVTRIVKSHDAREDVVVGTIPKGGNFTPNSDTNTSEKAYYGHKLNIGKVRAQALNTARKEWDGREGPSPNTLIYGANSGNKSYDPAGAVTDSSDGLQSLLSNIGSISDAFRGRSGRSGGGSGDAIVFPSGLGASGQDVIKFNMLKYDPQKFGSSGGKFGFSGRSDWESRIEGRVILPIPGGIQDTNSVQWGAQNMNAIQAAAAEVALGAIGGGVEGASGAVSKQGDAIKDQGPAVKEALKGYFAGQATGTGAQLLTRTTGMVMNPNMELLFQGPSLRPFSFSFKLSPRSPEEAKSVIKIIRFFKQGMAPISTDSNLFLKSPNTWQLQYLEGGQNEHKYLNKFKECALQSLNVSYTPDGNYATFEDGVMTAYNMTMTFQEIEPIFSSDYENESDDSIGF